MRSGFTKVQNGNRKIGMWVAGKAFSSKWKAHAYRTLFGYAIPIALLLSLALNAFLLWALRASP